MTSSAAVLKLSHEPSLASQPLFFFFLVRGEEKKKTSGDFSQVFVGLSQNVGTANQITSVS